MVWPGMGGGGVLGGNPPETSQFSGSPTRYKQQDTPHFRSVILHKENERIKTRETHPSPGILNLKFRANSMNILP